MIIPFVGVYYHALERYRKAVILSFPILFLFSVDMIHSMYFLSVFGVFIGTLSYGAGIGSSCHIPLSRHYMWVL